MKRIGKTNTLKKRFGKRPRNRVIPSPFAVPPRTVPSGARALKVNFARNLALRVRAFRGSASLATRRNERLQIFLLSVLALATVCWTAQLPDLYGRTTLGLTFITSAAAQGSEQGADQDQGTLRVTVVTPSGGRVAAAELSISLEGKSPNLKARTGHDGTYASPQLAAGTYQLNVISACYQPWEGIFRIEPGKEQVIDVTLKPWDTAAGAPTCAERSRQLETEVQYSDSTALKPSGLPASVDAGGYSSQAQGTQLRAALGEWADRAGAPRHTRAEWDAFNRGNTLLLQGDYNQAISVFQQGTAQYPHSNKLLLGLGVAYYSSGHYAEAMDALCRAVDLNPSERAAYFFMAQTYDASPAQTDAVLSRLESYAKRQPEDAAAQYYYALCLWRSRATGSTTVDPERVEQLLRSAVALDPSLADAHFQLGVVLADQREDVQALEEFERVIALEPGFAEAHYRAAQVYQRSGQRGKAEAELAAYDELRKQSASGDQKLRDDVRKLLLGHDGAAGN